MFFTRRVQKAYQQGYQDAMNQCNMQANDGHNIINMNKNYAMQQQAYNRRVRLANIAKIVLCIPVAVIVGLCFDKYFCSTLFHDNPVCYLILYFFMVL